MTVSSGSTRGSAQSFVAIVNWPITFVHGPVYLPVQLMPQPGKSPAQLKASVVTGSPLPSSTIVSVSKPVSPSCGWIW